MFSPFYPHPIPPESYSRELDQRVAAEERPYGYLTGEPPADTGDYDTASRESKKEYPRGKFKNA